MQASSCSIYPMISRMKRFPVAEGNAQFKLPVDVDRSQDIFAPPALFMLCSNFRMSITAVSDGADVPSPSLPIELQRNASEA
jgi:hypothetical protein